MNEQTPNPLLAISKALEELAEHRTAVDAVYKDLRFLEFRSTPGGSNYGKGLIFSGNGNNKHLVFASDPDQFFSSENFNLFKGKHYAINNVAVLTENTLGTTITKSNLKELGRLKGLVIDGSLNVNDHLFFNPKSDRLGIGTDEPNAALGVVENGIEVKIGADDEGHAIVGTHASTDLHLQTGNISRIAIGANGNVEIGNPTRNSVQVKVHGKLSIGVDMPDPAVDLHVAGAVRFNNKLQMHSTTPPASGSFAVGDIVWNTAPRAGGCVGWVCTKAGNPGAWNPFGEIRERG